MKVNSLRSSRYKIAETTVAICRITGTCHNRCTVIGQKYFVVDRMQMQITGKVLVEMCHPVNSDH